MLDKMCYHLLFYHHPFNLMTCWRNHGEELFKYMNSWYDIIFLFFFNTMSRDQNLPMHAKSLQLCPTLCDPMDCSSLGSSVQGILQARILVWVAIFFSRVFSRPSDWIYIIMSPALPDGIFTTLPPGKSSRSMSGFKMFLKLFPPINIHWLDLRFFCIPLFFPSFFFFFFFWSSQVLTASISEFIWIKKDLAFHVSWLKLNSISRAICENDSPSTRGMAFLDLIADLVSWDRNDSP